MKTHSYFFICGFLLPCLAQAATFRCQNVNLEVYCDAKSCSVSEKGDFTPMDISFNDEGDISACAYSGCYEGSGLILKDNRYLSIIGQNLVFSPSVEDKPITKDVLILFDKQDALALVKLGHVAQPMHCK